MGIAKFILSDSRRPHQSYGTKSVRGVLSCKERGFSNPLRKIRGQECPRSVEGWREWSGLNALLPPSHRFRIDKVSLVVAPSFRSRSSEPEETEYRIVCLTFCANGISVVCKPEGILLHQRFLRTAWIAPLLMFGVYVRLSVSEIRAGTNGSWSRLLTICFYLMFALSNLAAIAAGYLDRRDEQSKAAKKEA